VHTVTKPRHVQTLVVKKSAPTIASLCARRKVCHEVGRSGTGGRPWVFRIRAIVERPDAMPDVLERALDPRVAPRWVLLRHPHDQAADLGLAHPVAESVARTSIYGPRVVGAIAAGYRA
jgi:hypothetical protein